MKPVRKAIFPVAGLGTRFLPATKAMPKEMLPVVDKPLIQYAVEEAAKAGITDMIFITGRHKRAIEDHFDSAPELERDLEVKGKTALLKTLRDIVPSGINFIFIRQPEPLGLGHAVLCGEPVIGNEPFAVILADDLIDSKKPVIEQLMKTREDKGGGSVLAVQVVPREKTKDYGIVKVAEKGDVAKVESIIEKPDPDKAPSTLAVIGRYILEPEIFDSLKKIPEGAGGEIQLTDAIARELEKKNTYVCSYEGERFDCGSKQGFLNATVHFARKDGYKIA
ncbi:UTP--glucose-1-phosphate uridylyltransferase GalU [Turicimonas muris]|uniref:UTP--glucose-1-phosphate uridylyltransferase GalU n=3 Tax=Turicimonas muris TaxID=1796652 RepID=UPI0025A5523E|nr:UTP--glucose-1-phosphate uridylyltransferase GalU [Turicimonas muris]